MLNPIFYIRSVGLALSQIWANKTRSFLTALGIIVGVASVSAVIAALSGLKSKVLDEFEAIGASRMFIFPDRPDDAPDNLYPWEEVRLKESELEAIAENCPSIRAISPTTDLGMTIQNGERTITGITVKGIWKDWHLTSGRSILEGRPFTRIDEENARQVCVLNEAAVNELQLDRDPTGSNILLDGRRFLVVGLVETLQASMFGMNTSSAEIFIPFSVASKLQSPYFFFMINALIESPDLAEEAESEVRFTLRRMRGLGPEEPDTFEVAAIDRSSQRVMRSFPMNIMRSRPCLGSHFNPARFRPFAARSRGKAPGRSSRCCTVACSSSSRYACFLFFLSRAAIDGINLHFSSTFRSSRFD